MRRALALLRFALGQLLAGRRLPLVALPVALALLLPALVAHATGRAGPMFALDLVEGLVLAVLLPVVTLIFATTALGNEVRDGTMINLALKPIPRVVIVTSEYAAAVAATLLVLLPLEAAAHLVAAGTGAGRLLAGTLLATTVGALAYAALGVLVSLLAPRALLVGLAYAVLWEGVVVGVAPAAASFSVRGYAQGVLVAVLHGQGFDITSRLGPVSAAVLAAGVTVVALALAVRRLHSMDLR